MDVKLNNELQKENDGKEKKSQYGLKINGKFMLGACTVFLGLLLIVGVLTRVLPQGQYQREIVDGQKRIINGTYELLEDPVKLPAWRWFTAPFEALAGEYGSIVILIAIISVAIGGMYYVLDRADLLRRLVSFMYRKFNQRRYLLLMLVSLIFILAGSFFGICEEVVAFIPLMILLSISFGWDSLTGVGLSFLAVNRGYAASTLNPFGTAFVQGLADIPIYSGLWMRFIYLFINGAVFLAFMYFHVRRIEKNPMNSPTYDNDEKWRSRYTGQALLSVEKKKYPFREILKDFGRGALGMLPIAVIALLITGIQYLITEGNILDMIIHSITGLTEGTFPFGAALIMLAFVLVIEIPLPGTLVKALTVIPILLPVGEFSGISRQSTCLIFAIGDGFPNMLYPTDSLLILTLGMLGCGYRKWLKWLWPYILVTLAVSLCIIAFALAVNY